MLDNRCEIFELSICLFSNPDVSFSVYVLSTIQISRDATAVTNFLLVVRAVTMSCCAMESRFLLCFWSVSEECFVRLAW